MEKQLEKYSYLWAFYDSYLNILMVYASCITKKIDFLK